MLLNPSAHSYSEGKFGDSVTFSRVHAGELFDVTCRLGGGEMAASWQD